MTLTRFATKNAFRNRRRSLLTALSISFSLLLLTLLMSIYRGFYLEKGSVESQLRLITRHKVSLVFQLPSYYREKVRTIPGVVHVSPWNWFGGIYKDEKPENFFFQFTVDPNEIFQVLKDFKVPADQLEAFQRDRAGVAVAKPLALKHGWKLGDHIIIKGTIYPINPELTIRAMFETVDPFDGVLFNTEYIEQALPRVKGKTGTLYTLVDSPAHITEVSQAIDRMFENSPEPTKTESEKAFGLNFVASLGNVKLFILSICGAVVFTILLVSGNTMAMTIRERTREVAVLKTLGFTQGRILSLYVGEAITISLIGGLLGSLAATLLLIGISKLPNGTFFGGFKVTPETFAVSLLVAALVGFISAIFPAYNASRKNIVEGLRHIG
ncbi:MAG TPA: FtsX-like permease family protein [Candidatus Solibacter sp.]|jgi:putative ABC transport system permease protein|nr:FtsX-like permease family protein [Candidatus Solibacter sp.]